MIRYVLDRKTGEETVTTSNSPRDRSPLAAAEILAKLAISLGRGNKQSVCMASEIKE